MTTTYDEIAEYGQTIDSLQDENRALKLMLRRYITFGRPGMPGNLYNADLTASLREAEGMFSTMFSTLQVPAFAGMMADEEGAEPDLVITKANDKFAEYLNLSRKDIIGKSIREIGQLKSPLWMQTALSASKTLDSVSVEIQEGDDILQATIFSIRHGSIVAHFASASERYTRQRNKQVLQNLKFNQMIVNAIPSPVFYKDMDGRYLLCNQSYAQNVIGVSPETITGKTALELEEIFPKEYAGFYQEKDIELIKDKGIQTYQGPIKCADGQVREFIVNKTLIKDDNGQFVGILGVMQDIDRMLKARRELADSENRYKTLFNSICQPIIVVDQYGNIVMLNTTAVELFEEDDSSLMNNSVQVVPAIRLIDMEHVREVHQTGNPVSYRTSICKNGKERWYYCTMQPICDFFGEKVVQIIANDITNIKHYQAEILQQKQQAEESNNLKTVFLANIAHETRTPANIISGLSQMIKGGINPDRHPEYVEQIHMHCNKLLEIIDDIAQLSQIDSGQIKIRHEICSINNIVEEAFQYLKGATMESAKNISISHTPHINEYQSLIYADSIYIHQIFRKLINNAVTFTDSGSIEVGADLGDDVVTFYVRDTGIGIPNDKQGMIFERFRQVDEGESRKYGGAGLGLPIVSELIRRMDGSISVSSNVGQGSCFRFAIPYHKAGHQQ